MPFAVSIAKQLPYRGFMEEFSNVYQYGGPNPAEGDRSGLINAIADVERGVMITQVEFVSGRMWEIGGTPAENENLAMVDLSGTGSNGSSQALTPEQAILVQARSSRESIRSRPVYFRKWWHGAAGATAGSISTGQVYNQQQLTQADRDFFEAAFGDVATITFAGVEYVMMSTNGGVVQLPAVTFPWVEHRQFRA